MTKDEALKLALEALERCVATCFDPYAHEQAMSWSEHFVNQTITAIKEVLAQPEQDLEAPLTLNGVALYPQRTWVGLTDEEISDCMEMSIQKTCRAIEFKLKEKNT